MSLTCSVCADKSRRFVSSREAQHGDGVEGYVPWCYCQYKRSDAARLLWDSDDDEWWDSESDSDNDNGEQTLDTRTTRTEATGNRT